MLHVAAATVQGSLVQTGSETYCCTASVASHGPWAVAVKSQQQTKDLGLVLPVGVEYWGISEPCQSGTNAWLSVSAHNVN